MAGEVQTILSGDVVIAGAAGLPEVDTDLTTRIHHAAAVSPVTMAIDQIGNTQLISAVVSHLAGRPEPALPAALLQGCRESRTRDLGLAGKPDGR